MFLLHLQTFEDSPRLQEPLKLMAAKDFQLILAKVDALEIILVFAISVTRLGGTGIFLKRFGRSLACQKSGALTVPGGWADTVGFLLCVCSFLFFWVGGLRGKKNEWP